MILPKELRKISTGQIFAYTKALAQRKDMVPYWGENGFDPNVKAKGLSTEAAKENAFRDTIEDMRKEMNAMRKYIADLEAEKDRLVEENQKYLAILNKPAPKVKDEPTTPEMPDADRQALINDAVAAILEDKADGELTTTGIPRVEAIEARCGLANVTADERQAAMKKG